MLRPVLATWDIRSENRPIVPNGASFFAKAGEMRVQSTRSMLLVFVFPRAYFHEGEVQFVFCLLIFMKQRRGFRFHTLQERVLRWTKPPTTSLLLDTLADRALREIGTDCGKRALTTPTKCPPSTDQATDIPEGRSAASGGSG